MGDSQNGCGCHRGLFGPHSGNGGENLFQQIQNIYAAAQSSEDGNRCMVAAHPQLRNRIKEDLAQLRAREGSASGPLLHTIEPQRPGFNDGMIIPPESFPLGTPFSIIRSAAADRSPLRGILRVIVVLVDFSDKQFDPAHTQQHFHDLFFSQGLIPTKSVREYYQEATRGLIDIQGDVVGPFRLPQTLTTYAHGASGTGGATPNAQTMARDAAIAADPTVDFTPYDNDGNGFVDAFIVIHAGSGAEETGNANDIWSHKWTLDGGARSVDGTKIFSYLTVPEDCRIGVCCHELGHLLFGFPDLYDTDNSSEGIGNWCLMSAGSWGGIIPGDTPVHPSAWCKANQGWASVVPVTANGTIKMPDVKDPSGAIYRLWKDGAPGSEYFLLENRQLTGFDASLPGPGLLVWHIDDSISGNTNENHAQVALMQADGNRDLELNHNRGDNGDPFPGSKNNSTFNGASIPNSKSYSNQNTCVAVTAISPAGAVMTANVQVKCKLIKENKEVLKEARDKHKELSKEVRDHHKNTLKELQDKAHQIDKVPDKQIEVGGGFPGGSQDPFELATRVATLESLVSRLAGTGGTMAAPQPFIGAELRPDLSQGALSGEQDINLMHQQMQRGSAEAKRHYDSKVSER